MGERNIFHEQCMEGHKQKYRAPAPYDTRVSPQTVDLPPNFLAEVSGKPAEVTKSHYYTDLQDLDITEWRKLYTHYLHFSLERPRRTVRFARGSVRDLQYSRRAGRNADYPRPAGKAAGRVANESDLEGTAADKNG
jgi:hypothetical protein